MSICLAGRRLALRHYCEILIASGFPGMITAT
jgi:hypothetical protein